MYNVRPINPEIRLIGHEGVESVYPSYEYFLEHTSYYFINEYIIDKLSKPPGSLYWYGFIQPKHEYYVLRDEFGSVFSRAEILNDKRELNTSTWIYKSLYGWEYRRTPVPRTGKLRRRYFGCYYKRPRTTQERKWGYAHQEFVRGNRRPHNLPNSWDDKPRGDIDNRRSWKNKKIKRQWMKNMRA